MIAALAAAALAFSPLAPVVHSRTAAVSTVSMTAPASEPAQTRRSALLGFAAAAAGLAASPNAANAAGAVPFYVPRAAPKNPVAKACPDMGKPCNKGASTRASLSHTLLLRSHSLLRVV